MARRKSEESPEDDLFCELEEARDEIQRLKLSLEAVEEEKQLYKDLFDKSPIGVYRSRPDGSIILGNQSLNAMLGFESIDELSDYLQKKEAEVNLNYRQYFRQEVERRGQVRGMESVWVRKDNTAIHIRESAKAARGEDGEVLYYEGTLENVSERKQIEEELKQSLDKQSRIVGETVEALSITVDKRDPYTAGHQKRVAELACTLARELGHSDDFIGGLRIASTIHDIGKIYVPAEILAKPGKLSPEEMELVKMHSVVGYEILKNISFDQPIAEIVYQHHENLDGTGYPRGLVGDQIMMEARIISVADIVEALSTHRPYRPAFTLDVALIELKKLEGRLDRRVVDACISLFVDQCFTFSTT
ncbi:MAG: HD domain-containing protein [Deltaproteobacteria bacterium]|nr:HD domain-containing protein [Deltaproteobacteria bacterium]